MTGNEFQAATNTTAIYQGAGTGSPEAIVYCSLGLTGESGEIAEKVKKIVRKVGFAGLTHLSAEVRAELVKELGDVCWYVARMSAELGVSFDEVLAVNVEKLRSRAERGVLHGSGDNR